MDVLIFAIIIAVILIVLTLPLALIGAFMRRGVEKELNKRIGTVVTQYDPPLGLSPAEVGLLYDMKLDKKEFIATLFDLEQRGFIDIKNINNVTVLNNGLYKKLKKHEKLAIDQAQGIAHTAPIKVVDSSTGMVEYEIGAKLFSKSLLRFKAAVHQSVKDRQIKLKNYSGAFTLRVLIIAIVAGFWPLLFVAAPGTYNGVAYDAWSLTGIINAIVMMFTLGLFFFPVYLFVGYVLVWLWTRIAGRYWLNSKQARALWPQLEGYRLFLEKVDLDNIQFESINEQNPITKTLPYAMVLGLDTKWQERLNKQTFIKK